MYDLMSASRANPDDGSTTGQGHDRANQLPRGGAQAVAPLRRAGRGRCRRGPGGRRSPAPSTPRRSSSTRRMPRWARRPRQRRAPGHRLHRPDPLLRRHLPGQGWPPSSTWAWWGTPTITSAACSASSGPQRQGRFRRVHLGRRRRPARARPRAPAGSSPSTPRPRRRHSPPIWPTPTPRQLGTTLEKAAAATPPPQRQRPRPRRPPRLVGSGGVHLRRLDRRRRRPATRSSSRARPRRPPHQHGRRSSQLSSHKVRLVVGLLGGLAPRPRHHPGPRDPEQDHPAAGPGGGPLQVPGDRRDPRDVPARPVGRRRGRPTRRHRPPRPTGSSGCRCSSSRWRPSRRRPAGRTRSPTCSGCRAAQIEPYKVPEPGSRNVVLVLSTVTSRPARRWWPIWPPPLPRRPNASSWSAPATSRSAPPSRPGASCRDLVTAADIVARIAPAGPDNVSMLSMRHFMRNSGQLVSRAKEVFDAARQVADVVVVEAPAFLALPPRRGARALGRRGDRRGRVGGDRRGRRPGHGRRPPPAGRTGPRHRVHRRGAAEHRRGAGCWSAGRQVAARSPTPDAPGDAGVVDGRRAGGATTWPTRRTTSVSGGGPDTPPVLSPTRASSR